MAHTIVPFKPLKKLALPKHVVAEDSLFARTLAFRVVAAIALFGVVFAVLTHERNQSLERQVRVLQIEKNVLLQVQSMCRSDFIPQKSVFDLI